MKKLFALLSLSIWSIQAATTYYISYTDGNDANNGLTPATAWQYHPYMRPSSGSSAAYAHVAGDGFIFKGGDTWLNPAFCMRITKGGSSSSYDYYGTTNTWFIGPSWSRAIFDFQWISTTNAGSTANQNGAGVMIDCSGGAVNNIQFGDGIIMKRHLGALSSSGNSFGRQTFVLYGGATTNIILTNTAILDWDLPPITVAGEDNGNGGGVTYKDLTALQGLTLINSEVSDLNATQSTGCGLHAYMNVISNRLHDIGALFLGNGVVASNFCYNIGKPMTDPQAHENGFYNQGISVFHHNYLSNFYAQGFYDESGSMRNGSSLLWNTNNNDGITLYYDNTVIMNEAAFNAALQIDTENLSGGTSQGINRTGIRVYGNTFYKPFDPVIASTYRGGTLRLGYLEFIDNQFIDNQNITNSINGIDPIISTNTIVYSHNVAQTLIQATAQGFILSNDLQPSSTNSVCFRTGVDLSFSPFNMVSDRLFITRTTPPDIGSYQFVSTNIPPPPPPPPPPTSLGLTLLQNGVVLQNNVIINQ